MMARYGDIRIVGATQDMKFKNHESRYKDTQRKNSNVLLVRRLFSEETLRQAKHLFGCLAPCSISFTMLLSVANVPQSTQIYSHKNRT